MSAHESKLSFRGGCNICHGGNVAWTAKNTAMVAAQHYRKTGHRTWYEQMMRIEYGKPKTGTQKERLL